MPRPQKPLLDRLMNTSTGKVVHSTGYGTVQNPRGIGTASTQSFKERLAVDGQRSFVGRYKDARVMRESRNTLPQAKAYAPGEDGATAGGSTGATTGASAGKTGATTGMGASTGVAAGMGKGAGATGAGMGAAERAKMTARFEPTKPMSGGPTPPPRRNAGI